MRFYLTARKICEAAADGGGGETTHAMVARRRDLIQIRRLAKTRRGYIETDVVRLRPVLPKLLPHLPQAAEYEAESERGQ
jgi:hypothetical protein